MANGRPIRPFSSAGQTSDRVGARALLSSLPDGGHLLAGRGYDADWFRKALTERQIEPRLPSPESRKTPIPHAAARCRQRHRSEHMVACLKHRRRIALRFDRRPEFHLSAIALAAADTCLGYDS